MDHRILARIDFLVRFGVTKNPGRFAAAGVSLIYLGGSVRVSGTRTRQFKETFGGFIYLVIRLRWQPDRPDYEALDRPNTFRYVRC